MSGQRSVGMGMVGHGFMDRARSLAWHAVGRAFDLPVRFTAAAGHATAPRTSLEPSSTAGSPAGPITAILPAITVRGRIARMDPIPGVGQHSQAVLEELGLAHLADEKP